MILRPRNLVPLAVAVIGTEAATQQPELYKFTRVLHGKEPQEDLVHEREDR